MADAGNGADTVTVEQLDRAIERARAANDMAAVDVLEQARYTAYRQFAERRRAAGRFAPSFGDVPRRAAPPTVAEQDYSLIGNFIRGIGRGAVDTVESAALGAATILEEEDESEVRDAIQSFAKSIKPETEKGSFAADIGGGIGSVLAGLGVGLVGTAVAGTVGVPGAVGGLGLAGLLGVGASAGEASERARAAGATLEERNLATRRGAPLGLIDVVPYGRFVKALRIPGVSDLVDKLGKDTIEGFRDRAIDALATGGIEGAQEVVQGFLQNVIEQGYNPERELVDAGLLKEGTVGGIAGAALGLLLRGGRGASTTGTPDDNAAEKRAAEERAAREAEYAVLREQRRTAGTDETYELFPDLKALGAEGPPAPTATALSGVINRLESEVTKAGLFPEAAVDKVLTDVAKERKTSIDAILQEVGVSRDYLDTAARKLYKGDGQGRSFVGAAPERGGLFVPKRPLFLEEGTITREEVEGQRAREAAIPGSEQPVFPELLAQEKRAAEERAAREADYAELQRQRRTARPGETYELFPDLESLGTAPKAPTPEAVATEPEAAVTEPEQLVLPEVTALDERAAREADYAALQKQRKTAGTSETYELFPDLESLGTAGPPTPAATVLSGIIEKINTGLTRNKLTPKDAIDRALTSIARSRKTSTAAVLRDAGVTYEYLNDAARRLRAVGKKGSGLLGATPRPDEAQLAQEATTPDPRQLRLSPRPQEPTPEKRVVGEAEYAALQKQRRTAGTDETYELFPDLESLGTAGSPAPTATALSRILDNIKTRITKGKLFPEAAVDKALTNIAKSRKASVADVLREVGVTRDYLDRAAKSMYARRNSRDSEAAVTEPEQLELDLEKGTPNAGTEGEPSAASPGQDSGSTERNQSSAPGAGKTGSKSKTRNRPPPGSRGDGTGATGASPQPANTPGAGKTTSRGVGRGKRVSERSADGETAEQPPVAPKKTASGKATTNRKLERSQKQLPKLLANVPTPVSSEAERSAKTENSELNNVIEGKSKDLPDDANAYLESIKPITNGDLKNTLAQVATDAAVPKNPADATLLDKVAKRLVSLLSSSDLRVFRDLQRHAKDMARTGDFVGRAYPGADSMLPTSMFIVPKGFKHAVENNNLRGAVEILARFHPDPFVRNLATKLAEFVGSVDVFVEPTLFLNGRQVAGIYAPATNTIYLEAERGINPFVLLHEMAHAATVRALANGGSTPAAKALIKLFNDAKGDLKRSFGDINALEDVFEFASEVMGNASLRQHLQAHNPGVITRFFDLVKKLLLGIAPPPRGADMLRRADQLLDAVLFPASPLPGIDPYAMPATPIDGNRSTVAGVMGGMGKAVRSIPTLSKQDRLDDMRSFLFGNFAEKAKVFYSAAAPLHTIADMAEAVGLRDIGHRVLKAAEAARGAAAIARKRVDVVAKKAEDLHKRMTSTQQAALDDLVYSREYGATIFQVDPTLTAAEAARAYRNDSAKLAVWNAQQSVLRATGANGPKLYKLLRDEYARQYAELRAVFVVRLDDLAKGADMTPTVKNELIERLFHGQRKEYFPLNREGKYRLEYILTDPALSKQDAYVVQMFESRGAWERAEKLARANPGVDRNSIRVENKEFSLASLSGGKSAIPVIKQTVELLERAKPPADIAADPATLSAWRQQRNAQVEELLKNFVNLMPESSFARSLQRRKDYAGHETDVMHAFRKKAYGLAADIAKLRSSVDIHALEAELPKYLEAAPENVPTGGAAKSQAGRAMEAALFNAKAPEIVASELKKRLEYIRSGAKNKDSEAIVRRVTQGAFLWTLGGNVSSAVVQMSQVPMFLYPMLSGKYGWRETAGAIFGAIRIVNGSTVGARRGTSGGRLGAASRVRLTDGLDLYYTANDKGELTVRSDLGLDQRQKQELEDIKPVVAAAISHGVMTNDILSDALGVTAKREEQSPLDKVTAISAVMFNRSEQFNRQVSLVTTYKLARAAGEDVDTATQTALRAVRELNGAMFSETGPRIAQQGIGRVALMYKSYGINMYTTMFRTAKTLIDNAFPGTDAKSRELRRLAARQLFGLTGTSLFFSGVYGLPLYGAVQLLYDTLFQGEDEDDFNTMVRKYTGEGLFKGPLTALLDVDIASRTRLSGLLLQENKYVDDPTISELFGLYLGGPAISLGERAMRGYRDLQEGNIERGIEKFLPAALANVLKTHRYYAEGGIRTKRDDVIYGDLSGGELFGQLFGFTPSEYTRILEDNVRKVDMKNVPAQKRSRIYRKIYLAHARGDTAAYREGIQEAREFNRRYPSQAITVDSVRRSLKANYQTTARTVNGVEIPKYLWGDVNDHMNAYTRAFDIGW